MRVIEDWYEEMLARDSEEFAGIRGTWNQVRYIVHHHLVSIRREPGLSRLVFQELRPDPDYRSTRVFQLNQAYTHRIIDVVRAAVAAGEFRPDISPALVRDMIYGCIEHRTWAFLRNEGDFDLVSTTDGITEMIYRALAVAAERPQDALGSALARLEEVTARLERLEAAGAGGAPAIADEAPAAAPRRRGRAPAQTLK